MNISTILNFPQFYNEIKKEKMDFQLAYKLAKLKKEVDFHLNFYEENLNNIICKYGDRDEKGNFKKTADGLGIAIKQNMEEACQNEIKELLNLKITLPDFEFTAEDFKTINLSLENFETILPFVKE